MKTCSNCGAQMDESLSYCPYCGRPLDNSFNQSQPYAQPPYQQHPNYTPTEGKTVGILSIVFGAMGGMLGLILAIVGLCTYKEASNRRNCYIGLGLSLAWIVIGIIASIVITPYLLEYLNNLPPEYY